MRKTTSFGLRSSGNEASSSSDGRASMESRAGMNAVAVECPGQHAHAHVGPHEPPSLPGSGQEEPWEWFTWSALIDDCRASPAVAETRPATKRNKTTRVRRCSFTCAPHGLSRGARSRRQPPRSCRRTSRRRAGHGSSLEPCTPDYVTRASLANMETIRAIRVVGRVGRWRGSGFDDADVSVAALQFRRP